MVSHSFSLHLARNFSLNSRRRKGITFVYAATVKVFRGGPIEDSAGPDLELHSLPLVSTSAALYLWSMRTVKAYLGKTEVHANPEYVSPKPQTAATKFAVSIFG